MDYVSLTEKIREYTFESVKKSRYEHSVRVAETCARLCRMFGLDDDKGYLIGIGHDMCKDLPDDKMIEVAQKDGKPVTEFEMKKPALLHGRAAAVMMKEKFGITDEEMLEAVVIHTFGALEMSGLAKCLYIADKIEPGRPQSTEKYREKLYKMTLDEMTYAVLIDNYEYITKKGYEMYPETEAIIKHIRESIEK